MANQLLRALDRDVERLLMAGSATAVSDDALAQRKGEIEALAARVPALAAVAAQMGKVLGATPHEGGRELLTLATQNLRLKAAQIEVAPLQGEWAALPPTHPVETPLGSYELKMMRVYLDNRYQTSFQDLRGFFNSAVSRGDAVDLRLLSFFVHHISETYLLIPRFGRAALSPLQDQLESCLSRGSCRASTVSCLISTMIEIDAVVARPWVERCLASTDEEIRGHAVVLLPRVAPDEVEARAIALLADSTSPQRVIQGCLQVLSRRSSVEALDAMIQALHARASRRHAPSYVHAMTHPDKVARLVEALKAAAARAMTFVPFPPYHRCTTKKDLQQRKTNTLARQACLIVASLLEALPRPLPAEALVVVGSLSNHPIDEMREVVVKTLGEARRAAGESDVAGRGPGQTEGHGAGSAEVGGAGGVTASEMGVDRGGA